MAGEIAQTSSRTNGFMQRILETSKETPDVEPEVQPPLSPFATSSGISRSAPRAPVKIPRFAELDVPTATNRSTVKKLFL
jgi:hypothetical protein